MSLFGKLNTALVLGVTSFLLAAPAQAERLVIADSKGDRGMPAPFVHHKNGPGFIYTTYIFDSLVGQDENGKLIPELAQSWTASDDGKVFEITLQDEAKWHDGQPVTAQDVAFTMDYMAEHPYIFSSVANIAHTRVLSERKLQLVLKKPNPNLPTTLLIVQPILPKHIYEGQATPERFVDKAAATGSGPYKLVSYDKAQGRYLLEGNQDYHAGKPKFDQLAIVKMSSPAAIQAMKSGDVDIIPSLPLEKVDAAKAAGLEVLSVKSNHPVRLVYNHQGTFKDKSTRQALAYAIDRQALVDVVYRGTAVVADTGYFQEGSFWHTRQDDPSYPYNAVKAQVLFENSGWQKNEAGRWTQDGKPVTLRFVTEKRFKKIATALSDQLEAFGLEVDLRLMERAALQQASTTGNYDLTIYSSSTLGDPEGVGRRVLRKGWKSDQFGHHTKMKQLLNKQMTISDEAERRVVLKEFQRLYAEELPAYMLANPIWATAHNDKVTPRFLPNGIAIGIPSALPKRVFVEAGEE